MEIPDRKMTGKKVVLITGGSKGIGLGCVQSFSSNNYNVVFCSRNVEEGLKIQREYNCKFFQCDVSYEEQMKNLIDATISIYGKIDCLINNAGWHPPSTKIDDFDTLDLYRLMKLNFYSVFWGCKYSLPFLRKTKGNIINMSSLVGINGQKCATTYSATKGAITSFSKSLAIDEAKNGVRVNIVSPGNILTPLLVECANNTNNPKQILDDSDMVQHMERKGTIKEVGDLCLCISEKMTFTTGVDHIISGGAELGYGKK